METRSVSDRLEKMEKEQRELREKMEKGQRVLQAEQREMRANLAAITATLAEVLMEIKKTRASSSGGMESHAGDGNGSENESDEGEKHSKVGDIESDGPSAKRLRRSSSDALQDLVAGEEFSFFGTGVEFQRIFERKAAVMGGGDFVVPVQMVTDFLDNRLSVTLVPPSSYRLGVEAAGYDRQKVADHANNLATKIRSNLTNSMKALGVDILTGFGTVLGPQKLKFGKGDSGDKIITAKDIIIATGSVPLVPKGIEVDGKTVITSDHALKLEFVPQWIAIVGSGYIGLEFSDVYTALGSEVTFIEALDQIMPGFDPEIGKLAQRVLVNPRKIDSYTGVFASKITPAKDGKPVQIEMIDAKTKEPKETLEVDAALIATGRAPFTKGLGLENINVQTQRGFVPVDERMRVIDANGKLVPHLYCIGDANGKMMLAHAASAQGISVVEQVTGNDHVLNHLSIPAACFTHPEISMVGLTEPQAREKAEKEGFEVSIAKTSFKANTKALAENEGEGMAKLIYRPDNGEILGVHIFGLHAADLIHEASNAIALGTRIQDIKFAVHAHPTLSEVLDELFKSAKVKLGASKTVSKPVAV